MGVLGLLWDLSNSTTATVVTGLMEVEHTMQDVEGTLEGVVVIGMDTEVMAMEKGEKNCVLL